MNQTSIADSVCTKPAFAFYNTFFNSNGLPSPFRIISNMQIPSFHKNTNVNDLTFHAFFNKPPLKISPKTFLITSSSNPILYENNYFFQNKISISKSKSLICRIGTSRNGVHLSRAFDQTANELETYNDENCVLEVEVLFQAFSWTSISDVQNDSWYNNLNDLTNDISDMGFTHVLLPPPSKSSDPQGFQPQNFYDLNSNYGSEKDLRTVTKSMKDRGLKLIVEIILNRLSGNALEERVAWKSVGGTIDQDIDWEEWIKNVKNRNNRKNYFFNDDKKNENEIGDASAIDHANPSVQSEIKLWLLWLRNDIGFDGLCFEYAKMFDPLAVNIYCKSSDTTIAVGDFWNAMRYNGLSLEPNQDQHRQELCNWIKATKGVSMAFDYTTKGILQQAIEKNEYWRLEDKRKMPAGLIGWWPSQSVTFIDNHITGSSQNAWPFPPWGVLIGYAYILTHPGLPCVFYDHVYSWNHKQEIKELISIRKRNDINACSEIKILLTAPDIYVAKIGKNVNSEPFFGIYVKLGPAFNMQGTEPGPGWEVCISGRDFCVWERQAQVI